MLVGKEYGGLHGREFLGNIYWVMARETPQKTVPEVVELPSSNLCVTCIGADIFILTLNHADVIGDQHRCN